MFRAKGNKKQASKKNVQLTNLLSHKTIIGLVYL